MRIGADRRRLVGRLQHAGAFQRGQPAVHPLRGVGGEHAQAARGNAVGEDGAAQFQGIGSLFRDELVARQRGGGGHHIHLIGLG